MYKKYISYKRIDITTDIFFIYLIYSNYIQFLKYMYIIP